MYLGNLGSYYIMRYGRANSPRCNLPSARVFKMYTNPWKSHDFIADSGSLLVLFPDPQYTDCEQRLYIATKI